VPQGTEPHVTILNRQIGHHHVIICSTGPKKYSILPLSLRGVNLYNLWQLSRAFRAELAKSWLVISLAQMAQLTNAGGSARLTILTEPAQ
jgi:hypothetical protein